jgi:hypothetical protein
MWHLTGIAMVIGAVAAPSAAGAKHGCPLAMYQRADASLVHARASWSSLSMHFEAFASCDDGALAEGYSDAIVTLLARRWGQFDAFVVLSARNPAFRRWALRHIDASASTDDLRRVLRNAERCTGNPETRRLCGEMARAARDALGVGAR